MPLARASVSGLGTDNWRKWGKPNGCMFWKHDDAMHMMTWYAMHDTQAHDKATTANNWRTLGTSVSGRHNTPPLREDLVPRSRMAPEEQRKRKRGEVKLSCSFDEWVKPNNLARLNKFETEYNEGEQGQKHSFRKEEQRTLRKNLEVEGQDIYWNHSG